MSELDLTKATPHPLCDQVVDVICEKTMNPDRQFFHINLAYNLGKVANMQRTKVKSKTRGVLPTNMYAINLAPSGYGKGHCQEITKEYIVKPFMEAFNLAVLPTVLENRFDILAEERSNRKDTEYEAEYEAVKVEYRSTGTMLPNFDSGTSAALKQMRNQLLISQCGAMNLEIDEIGSNLVGNTELLNLMLELYDTGQVKQKLIKNTAENTRMEHLEGCTPSNMLLFGTTASLLDGGKTQSAFELFIETGFGRRCFYGYAAEYHRNNKLTAEEAYELLTKNDSDAVLESISKLFGDLGEYVNYNRTLPISKENDILLLDYKLHCEALAEKLPEFAELERTELLHRFFKTTKMAANYAFMDKSSTVEENHIYNAIWLAEKSGQAFKHIIHPDKNYVRLAKYTSQVPHELTQVELSEALPFYRGSKHDKAEMLTMATAWGYRNAVLIKTYVQDSIEFIRGESLSTTNLDKMILSYSNDLAHNYENVEVEFEQLHELTGIHKDEEMRWCNQHLDKGHRRSENVQGLSNMIVLDVDGTFPLDMFKGIFKEFTYHLHTTKSHGKDGKDRYRVVMPTKYVMPMNSDEYKVFMENIVDWLPFEVDPASKVAVQAWSTHDGAVNIYNEGELLDPLPFIPKTARNAKHNAVMQDLKSLDRLERWFIHNTDEGGRNRGLLRYALMLADNGRTVSEIEASVLALNTKLKDPLPESEIKDTIMVTIHKKV